MNSTMNRRTLGCTLLATTLLAACNTPPKEWKTPAMTSLGPRLEPLFQKTRTVCFGRFVIDLPESALIAWGPSGAPLSTTVYADEGDKVAQRAAEREKELKAEVRYPRSKGLSMHLETVDGAVKGQKTVISQQTFSSTGLLRIESYFRMGSHLVKVNSLPTEERKARALSIINDMAQRLRPRAADEVPTEPGTCLEDAFMVDPPGGPKQPSDGELIRIGFSLPAFDDVNLSVFLLPGNSSPTSGNTFKGQLEEADRQPPGTYLSSRFLRRGDRHLAVWGTGFEALSRSDGAQEDGRTMHAHHEFIAEFLGETGNVFRPRAKVELYTGVANDTIGATKASLTDAEAIALWDKLTSSIRMRPVTAAPKPVSQAEPVPLGTVAATGSLCPQTGWWECAERDTVQGGRRQFFRTGERLPEAVLLYPPTLRQRLQGVVPSHRTVTVWKLMEPADDTPAA